MNFRIHIAVLLFVLVAAGWSMPVLAQATPAPASPSAAAAAPKDPKAEAIRLLGRKQFATACVLLKDSYPEDTRDITVLFLRARCRMGLKDYGTAVDLYEKLVKIEPDSARAKDEYAKAVKLYRAQRQISYFRLETGVTYDTNINSGPQNDQIVLGGVPISLGEEPIQATGYLVSGSAGYIMALDRRLSLTARASASQTDYFHGSDNAVNNFSVSVGPSWNFGRAQFSLSPGYSWQGFAGDAYNSSLDLSGRASLTMEDKATTAAVNFSVNANNYRGVPDKNGISYSISPNLSFKLPQEMTGMMSLILRFENDEKSYYSNDAFGFRFGLTKKLGDKLETNLAYQLTERNYESADGFISTDPRKDEQQVLSTSLTYDISGITGSKSTDLNLRYQYIKTDSNIGIYDLDRHVLIMSISRIW